MAHILQTVANSELIDTHPHDLKTAMRLGGVDWTFPRRTNVHPLEKIHPYPAKFIGEIPRTLLQELSIPAGTSVFDPFCGSGTTLVESQRLGISAIGVDLNPIACLISRVKTSPLHPGFSEAVSEIVERARGSRSVHIPEIPNLDHWFKPDVQSAVSALTDAIGRLDYTLWFDQLRLALSSILVRVSNQESDTRYAAVEKEVNREDVFSCFSATARRLENALAARDWPLTTATIIEGNTLTLSPQSVATPVGMVITSPPYPNAYEYWLYHKYRMWWLGFDPISVRAAEIGARAHFFKKKHHTALHFNEQMTATFGLIREVLVPGGYVCFVVGRSKIHGRLIENGDTIASIASGVGMRLIARIKRAIDSNRKSFNLSHANIKTETVLVFQRPLC